MKRRMWEKRDRRNNMEWRGEEMRGKKNNKSKGNDKS